MDTKLIKKFCKTLDINILEQLSPTTVQLLINASFSVLFEKYGREDIALIVLRHFSLIYSHKYTNIYTSDYTLTGYEALMKIGVTTIPIFSLEELPNIRNLFISTLHNFPEYLRDTNNNDKDISGNPLLYSLGGFAALGNPSSFHNTFVRNLRKKAHEAVLPFFRQVIKKYSNKKIKSLIKLETLFDRMMYRLVSQQPVEESWHRDVIPQKLINYNDEVYGGWINLDETNQYFSCIPGSHLGVRLWDLASGFARIPKDQIPIINKFRHKITVPPGHMIIFPQYILHEVVAQKASHNMMRLFTGWRLTTSSGFLHSDMLERLNKQSIMPLPSGQLPPMYAANHGSFYLHKSFKPIPNRDYKINLIEWSNQSLQPVILINRPAKGDYPAYKISPRWLESLEHYNLPKYPLYTDEELAIYKPHIITQ